MTSNTELERISLQDLKKQESFNIDAFYSLVKRFKLEFTLTTITELPRYRDSIQLYNPNLNAKQIQEWIKTIIK